MKCTNYTVRTGMLSLTIALLSDLHLQGGEDLPALLLKEKPDLIALTGDMLVHTALSPVRTGHNAPSFALLSVLPEIAPVYYSIGNHEGGMSTENREEIENAGITLLDNRFVHAHGMCIGGLTSPLTYEHHHVEITPAPDTDFLHRFAAEPGFHLLLNHHPEFYPTYIRETPVELTLSGHAHGGQWHLFGKDIYAPGQGLFPRYASGIHENRLIVTRGLANTAFPIPRIGNPTELVFIHLTSEAV